MIATVGGGGLPIGGDGAQFQVPPVVNEIVSTAQLSEGNIFTLPMCHLKSLC